MRKGSLTSLLFLVFFQVVFTASLHAEADDTVTHLKSLNIEDLLETEVTSVSKKSEKLADATAAVFVITSEDIRRCGARTIAEALRMAPGLQVAQIDANKWAISARGFNDTFSNKLLVLIDGRSVYTPLYSGVIWDVQDTLLEDIDRIEVIRGPGATLWGANAVNGVINIITKSAQQTQGALLKGGAGSHEPYSAAARYGDHIGSDGAWRVYAKGFDRSAYVDRQGDPASDQWASQRAGFRMDLDLTARDAFTFQGDTYKGSEYQTLDLPDTLGAPSSGPEKFHAEFSGANLLSRWRRSMGDSSDLSVQLYFDHTQRQEVVLEETRNTLDLDCQHRFSMASRQEIVWGLGYRWTQDDTQAGSSVAMLPESRTDQLFSAFVQNEITLQPSAWWLTLGSKFEHNDYTGFEIQPAIRLRWKPELDQTAWAAVSRAVRTPSRAEHNLRSNRDTETVFGNVFLASIFGDDAFQSEELLAYELGYRWQPKLHLSLDAAAFFNQYDNLRTVEPTPDSAYPELDPQPPHMVVPAFIDNKMEGETYGVELTASWRPLTSWKLSAGYTWLQVALRTDADSSDSGAEREAGFTPAHQFQLRSYLDLPFGLSWDAELYFVDRLPEMDIPSYTRLDLRLGWQPSAHWEFSFSIENALDDQHTEFGERTDIVSSDIPRQFYGQVIWRY